LVFRYEESGPYFRFGHEGGTYEIDAMVGVMPASMPVVVTQYAAVTRAAGDVLEVRQASDGTVESFVNGVRTHRFSYPGGTGLRSTLTGLGADDTTTVFDDFTVSPVPQ
jgi:hypothetical protein